MGGGKRSTKSGRRQSLFVEGGTLSSSSSSSSSSPGEIRSKAANAYPNPPIPRNNAFPYHYPSPHFKDVEQSNTAEPNSVGHPVILLGSKDNNIVAFLDPTPSSSASPPPSFIQYTPSHFVLASEEPHLAPATAADDEQQLLHRGLGFSHHPLNSDAVVFLSSTSVHLADGEEPSHNIQDEDDQEHQVEQDEDVDYPAITSSAKKNSAFVSIGGVRVYTQDISDDEEDEDEDGDEDEDSSDDGEGSSTESSDSEDSSDLDFHSDIDEDVMEDYLDGIGGTTQLYKSKWLASQDLAVQQLHDHSDDDSSSDEYGDTLNKLSGVALQEASREYGMQKHHSKKKPFTKSTKSKAPQVPWSSALDDLLLVKDPRRLSGKKKHGASFPQSWPSEGQKSKKHGRLPGEKKKHRKEMIAVKRRERMLNRGVDLEQINSKLKQMVLKNVDMLSFPPMHTRDCSQVQRLAAIYRLSSGCQCSGKKRFVTVSRTRHTSLPSASDEIRLEKLIGSSKDDADFPVVDTRKSAQSGFSHSKSAKKLARNQGGSSSSSKSEKQSGQKLGAYNQPVSFISSGLIESEITKVSPIEPNDNCSPEDKDMNDSPSMFGSFEVHTKGFGSKMMAKMGYVEGEGLGKEGKGMSQPIEVIQRPKSLGLGMSFVESSNDIVKVGESSSEMVKVAKRMGGSARSTPNIGAFEKHTKGFGSKMMAKMGFVEGKGLGRDSQGMVTPLSAVRRPKARVWVLKGQDLNF